MFRRLVIAAMLLVLTASCAPGQIFGPPTAKVSIIVTSRLQGDVLAIYINGVLQEVYLTDDIPTYTYWERVQVVNDDNYYYNDRRDYGKVFVSAWSFKLGRQSRTKSQTAYTDRVISFEFTESDFR